MIIVDFTWHQSTLDKIWKKHHVSRQETEEVFCDKPRFRFLEAGEVEDEDIYLAWGQTDAGRYVSVVFIYKGKGEALIITARDMMMRERRKYAQK